MSAAGPSGEAACAAVADGLAGPGWAVVNAFLPPETVAALAAGLADRDAAGGLKPAATGAGANRAVRPEIRGDRIAWLDGAATDAERRALGALETLRTVLNRELVLGLDELECHYASYAPGAHYARHLDRSPAGAERVVSAILYLNPDWDAADGGELRLYVPGAPVDVLPHGGTLVAFLSERFEHEVRASARVRLSLTGWFRRRPFAGVR
jgi:SM-20-related protein